MSRSHLAGREPRERSSTAKKARSNVAHSPVVTRRRLGTELRRLRVVSGKTIEQAADELECSAAKISRLETGRGVPKQRDVRDLLRLYGVGPDEVVHEEMLELASEGQSQGWWNDFKDLDDDKLPEHIGRYIALEQGASVIQGFEGDFVHGLLQTEAYADAVIRELSPSTSNENRSRMVQLRMTRQDVLKRSPDPLDLRVILSESALMRPVGGPAVMRDQLHALRDKIVSHDNVKVRIMALRSGVHLGLGSPFSIIHFKEENDQDVVYLEGHAGATYLEKATDVARYSKIVDGLWERVQSRDESMALLEKHAEQILTV
jgi:transcriptional regulator with XRE-family HTH domain